MSLLATVAAFGVARLVFQDGVLDRLLGWESQGFVDAWAPIFFFALIFALAMDYTVFLLATVRAVHDRTGDARQALVEGLAGTGRVINAAAGVMVVVFMTFALVGPDRAAGDGRHPRRRGAARRDADPAAAAAGRAASARRARMVDAGVARPPGPERRAVPRAAVSEPAPG